MSQRIEKAGLFIIVTYTYSRSFQSTTLPMSICVNILCTFFISRRLSCFDWTFSGSMYVNFGVEADFLITL